MPTRTPPARRSLDTPELDRAIAAAEADAIVVWSDERLPFAAVPDRIAQLDSRGARDGLYGSYLEAVEALNPLYEQRLAHWTSGGDVIEAVAANGIDPRDFAVDLERFILHSETPYYAALRRYLAVIDIEQGDATVADVWHIARGARWSNWFGDREMRRAITATGRNSDAAGGRDGWLAAEAMLSGEAAAPGAELDAAVSAAYATLAGSPEWLAGELGVAAGEVTTLADFAAFVRLWRLRRHIGLLQVELRLFGGATEPAIARAYSAGIMSHITGVAVAEQTYLSTIPVPFASVGRLRIAMLAADLVETLEQRHGATWWRDPASAEVVDSFGAASSVDDGLAQLGYDALDWRPVLRQIRARLIGEMSGYGGPNITTRAGTRKV
ncbi:hypothetical protein BH23CHL9_BH23CHL9_14350 [soil metagenome]